MNGQITKIHPRKKSRNGNIFIRIEFKLDDGSWAKTDVCPDFRNFDRWKNLLTTGRDVSGLKLKRKYEVDADSFVQEMKHEPVGRWVQGASGMAFVYDKIEEIPEPEPEKEPEQLPLL